MLIRYLKNYQKKNQKQLEIIHKKIQDIRENPNQQYKFLRAPLHGFNRVHIDQHFVLIFSMNHQTKIVTIFHYDHHDFVYKWQPKPDE